MKLSDTIDFQPTLQLLDEVLGSHDSEGVNSCVFIGNPAVASAFPGLRRELEGWQGGRSLVRCRSVEVPADFRAVPLHSWFLEVHLQLMRRYSFCVGFQFFWSSYFGT